MILIPIKREKDCLNNVYCILPRVHMLQALKKCLAYFSFPCKGQFLISSTNILNSPYHDPTRCHD